MEQNIQLYGRNDMVMLQDNKIYGSLGLAEKYIVKTKQGTPPLLLESSLKSKFLGMNIYGKSTQETTDGVNVYAGGDITATWENAEDGSIAVNTNGIYISKFGNIFENGGYMSFYCDVDIPIKAYIAYSSLGSPPTNHKEIVLEYIRKGYNTFVMPSYVFNEVQTGVRIQIRKANTKESPGVPYTFTLSNIMVKVGQEEHDYEPYTGGMPSPNPDYPQEIKSVGGGGSIDVNITGAQLADFKNARFERNSQSIEIDETGFTFTVDKERVVYIPANIEEGKTYTLQYDYTYNESSDDSAEIDYRLGLFISPTLGGGRQYISIEIPVTFTANFDADHIVMFAQDMNGKTCKVSNVMLNEGSTALPWEPYKQPQTMVIPTPNGLPGIPVSSGGNYTDESGQQWVCDEIDFERGKYVKRVMCADLKEAVWSNEWDKYYHFDGTFIVHTNNFNNLTGQHSIFICSHFIRLRENILTSKKIQCQNGQGRGFNIAFRVPTTIASNIKEWKQWVSDNNMQLLFPLKTPIETDITEEEIVQYKTLHSNYPITIVDNSEQAEMSVTYKSFENA